MTDWERIARFLGEDGQEYWTALPAAQTEIECGAHVSSYPSIEALEKGENSTIVVVQKVLAPVPSPRNPIICLGGNYKAHVEEANVPSPTHPACMWYKSRFALAHPNATIPIPKHAYENFLDYEGELVIVTSKDALNVSVEDAPDYILGYTCGNDLTARDWHDVQRSSIQLGYSKGFDNFAPLGPSLVSKHVWKAAPQRHLKTYINGRKVQDAALETMTFTPEEVVSFLSQGHTLEGGSAIMTGTPLGVGFFSKPQYSLKDGDVVHVEISPIGTLRNKMRFGA